METRKNVSGGGFYQIVSCPISQTPFGGTSQDVRTRNRSGVELSTFTGLEKTCLSSESRGR